MADSRTDETAMSVELLGGYVTIPDLEYACDKVRGLCADASRAVRHCRTHLCADIDSTGRWSATVDAILILDGELVICAGAVAATMREAVDQLSSRLRRRITALCERDERSTSRSYEMAATTAAT